MRVINKHYHYKTYPYNPYSYKHYPHKPYIPYKQWQYSYWYLGYVFVLQYRYINILHESPKEALPFSISNVAQKILSFVSTPFLYVEHDQSIILDYWKYTHIWRWLCSFCAISNAFFLLGLNDSFSSCLPMLVHLVHLEKLFTYRRKCIIIYFYRLIRISLLYLKVFPCLRLCAWRLNDTVFFT